MNTSCRWSRPLAVLQRGLRNTLIVAAAAWLSACGGGGGDAAEPDAGPLGDPVTKTLGTAGGGMAVTTRGITVTLTVPQDALEADTVVTVTPDQPAPGETLRLKLRPAGLVFTKPITMTVQFPPGQPPAALASLVQSLGSDNAVLTTTRDALAGTLTAQLTTFGGRTLRPLAQALQPGALNDRALSDGRKSALDAGPDADVGLISVYARFTTDELVAHVRRLISFARADEIEVVLQLQLSIANVLERHPADAAQAATIDAFLADAKVIVCNQLAEAITASRATPITGPGQFKSLIARIMNWHSIDLRLGGARCSGQDPLDAAHDVIQRDLAWAKVKFAASGTPADIAPPANDMRDARVLKNEARMVQNTDSSGRTLNLNPFIVALQDELLSPALDEARKAAWRQAKATGSLAHHVPLINGFGASSLLQQDAQYVRTSISLTTRNSAGNIVSTTAMGVALASELPADPVRTASLNARNASIEIGGSIGILNVDAGESETLQVSFDGVNVASISSRGDVLLGSGQTPPTLTGAGLLAAAGLPSNDSGTHTLRILRTGAANALRLGITDDVLATITLNFAPSSVSATFTGAWVYVNTCPNVGNDTEAISVAVTRDAPGSDSGQMTVVFLRRGDNNHHDYRLPVAIRGDLAAEAQLWDPPHPEIPGYVPELRLNIHPGSADYSGPRFSINTCDDRAPGGGGSGITFLTMSLVRQ